MRTLHSLGLAAGTAIFLLTAPALAEGDIAKGEEVFQSNCKQCHKLEEGARGVGPSLYNIVGRPAGAVEGVRYSKLLKAAAEAGLVWDVENIAAYTVNPKDFLKKFLTDQGLAASGRSSMSFKFGERKADLAPHVAAYLLSLSVD